MVHYSPIRKWTDKKARDRVIEKLLALRGQLFTGITKKRSAGSFLLATWNLRDFDSNKFGHGKRLPESFYYIAEIMSVFDLIAVQEVNRDLTGFKKLVRLLGPNWDYIATDTTEGSSGNTERMAFVFNRDVISFANIAGEVVLPVRNKIIVEGSDAPTELQFARTPFVAAFQAGWFKFNLCSVHIFFGSDSGEKLKRRVDEISAIAKFFKKRQEKEKGDYILLGDFNIKTPKDKTMKALTNEGFKIPSELASKKTNLKGDKHYDQIALRVKNKMLEIDNAGVFDFEDVVFQDTDEDFTSYQKLMPEKQVKDKSAAEKRKYYKDKWRAFQMSDHKPMWIELKVDFTNDYLKSLKPSEAPLADMSGTT